MKASIKAVQAIINTQWEQMLSRGIIPCFEFEMPNDEYLLVNLSIDKKGIYFMFDENDLPVSFDGDIKKDGDSYYLPFCEYTEDLDLYLQMISENITEGYLLPNDLFV